MRLLRATLSLFLLLAPRTASATVGGPETLEIVGHDPHDAKIYLLRTFHDEGERLPRLEYVLLRGPERGKTIVVKSWYRGADATDGSKLAQRLAQLRARLSPLATPSETPRLAVRTVARRSVPPQVAGDPPWDARDLEISMQSTHMRGVMRRVALDESATFVTWRTIPNEGRIAILRTRSILFELGYEADAALLLR